jgi:hypothetical protein
MPQTCATPTRHALTIADAAAMAGKSVTWVRRRLNYLGFDSEMLMNGRRGVMPGEVRRMIAEDEEWRRSVEQRLWKLKRPALRLVWSNPDP